MKATLDTTKVRRWRRHEEYRASNAKWHWEVPKHWSVRRLKYLAEMNPSKSEVSHLPDNTEVSFLPMEQVGEDGSLLLDRTKPIKDVYQGFTYFRNGDVLVAKITPCFENGKGALAVGLENGVGFGTTEFHVLRPGSDIDGRYLELVTRLHAFRGQGVSEFTGAAGQQRVPESFIKNYVAPVPPLPEQQAISAFLDREATRIDALIGHKQRLIALLEEKRRAVIAHAVTKGLDPNAKMKDSGVEWIGEIPEHWEVWRLKHACRLETGHTPRKSEDELWVAEDCTIPWISLNDTKTLYDNDFIEETAVSISAHGMAHSAAHLIEAGAVVVNRDGARVGLSAITTRPMCVSQHIIAWVCGPRTNNYFLLHVLYAMEREIYRITAGATIPTIGMPEVKGMTMPLPPLVEQVKIVDHLLAERQRIAGMTERLQDSIDALHEYRTALISAAVTGQIDVREEVQLDE